MQTCTDEFMWQRPKFGHVCFGIALDGKAMHVQEAGRVHSLCMALLQDAHALSQEGLSSDRRIASFLDSMHLQLGILGSISRVMQNASATS